MTPVTCDEVRDLLPAFVLGALERHEMDAVRMHLDGCELHAEAGMLGGVVGYLAAAAPPVEPPAALKDRILAAAAADLEARRASAAVAADAAVAVPAIAPPPVPRQAPRVTRSWGWALQVAAVIAVVLLGAWNVGLQARLGELERDVAAARAYELALADALAAASEPGAVTAVLGPAETGATRGLAAVRPDGSFVLVMRGLEPTAGSEVYEAWVIVADAAPLPVGSFTVGASGTGVLNAGPTPAGPGATLALTREPATGATTPTLPIVAVGTAAS